VEWFRQEIRKAYGGRAPKVLDPFAGGGAIPLEAMRLGCEATAADINPVAWFILKCTLEYPQKLAGKTWPLPDFILENEKFMHAFYKAHPHLVGRTKWTKRQNEEFGEDLFLREKTASYRVPKADLAWHVRAWGQWVLDRARRELAKYYPTYADFEPFDKHSPKPYEKQPMRLLPLKEDGTPDIEALNAEFSSEYLADKRNPRWVAKPTVAYLWARTVKCKNCRATVPLLKTRWLCKKDRKRVLLTMKVEQASVPAMKESGGVSVYRRKLPHWRMEGAVYFLTWRLNQKQSELVPAERDLVVLTLRHFHNERYRLHGYVVMNDHVHILVEPMEGHELSSITHSWKSFAAHELQKKLGRKGAIWQDESFDRIVRDETEFLEKAQYIQNNP
jgi:REP element-mobilizing transposase RayT